MLAEIETLIFVFHKRAYLEIRDSIIETMNIKNIITP